MAHGEWCLKPDETLKEDEYLTSKNGCFHAVMQKDSNFVIYRGDWAKYQGQFSTAMWYILGDGRRAIGRNGPKSGPYYITMQGDGNLVVYGEGHKPFWAISGYSVDWGRAKNGWAALDDTGVLYVAPDGDWSKKVWSTLDTNNAAKDEVDESSLEFDSIEYDLTPGHVKIQEAGPPRESLSEICVNDTDVEQELEISISWRKSSSKRMSSTSTLKIGVATTFETGIPIIAKGQVKLSVDFSQQWSWGETKSESEALEYKRKIRVPPHTKVQGRLVWNVSKAIVPFKYTGTAKFKNWSYGRIPIHVEGVFEGTNSHDLTVSWSDITEKPEVANLRFWRAEETVQE